MLARSVPGVPEPDAVAGGLAYEPKWDGFRAMVVRSGTQLRLTSRGGKSLTRYFPELVEPLMRLLPQQCVLDGEIVVRVGAPGAQHLDWQALSQRVHPAASRVELLSREFPAEFIAFDLLAIGDRDLTGEPFMARRLALEQLLAHVEANEPLHVTALTLDAAEARDWFERFEGAGLDGVVAKPLTGPYTPGRRTMLKVKHRRSADAVVIGYRLHTSGRGVGSLLLGLYDARGELHPVGGIVAFTQARRLELVEELEPLVMREPDGAISAAQGQRSRFTGAKDISYVPLRPERVVEVAFDQLEQRRFRHAVTFLRWRPDKPAHECRFDQIDQPAAYDLAKVLMGD